MLNRPFAPTPGLAPDYDWPGTRQTLLRVSAQAYNDLGQYARLADALEVLLEGG